jgi:hypothetical protein
MSKAIYSKILNKYVRADHPILKKQPYYWNQCIGRTRAIVASGVFDDTFDDTFN